MGPADSDIEPGGDRALSSPLQHLGLTQAGLAEHELCVAATFAQPVNEPPDRCDDLIPFQ